MYRAYYASNPVGPSDFVWFYKDYMSTWCKDCMSVYRTCYTNMLTLVLFELWVSDPKNRLALLGKLCAWVMLRIDGVRSVRKEHVDAREHSLRQLFALLQIPYPIFDVAALGSDFEAIEHASLTECVLVAVSLIVYTNGGDESQEYAREMLGDQIVKDASFPASLRSLLRAMVSTAP